MDNFETLLILGIFIERVMEIVVDIADSLIPEPMRIKDGQKTEGYKTTIRIGTLLGSLLAGVIIVQILDLNFFTSIEDADTGQLLSGLIAGVLAPYSHQLFEIVKKSQQRIKTLGNGEEAESEKDDS